MSDPFLAIEMSAVGVAMRASFWLYPVVNIFHVLAIATLFGSVLLCDLALAGAVARDTAQSLLRLGRPFMLAAFAVAAASGILMFTADARVLAANPFLWAKLALIAAAMVNFLVFMRLHGRGSKAVRPAAIVSLLVWLAVVVCGRAIAYW